MQTLVHIISRVEFLAVWPANFVINNDLFHTYYVDFVCAVMDIMVKLRPKELHT